MMMAEKNENEELTIKFPDGRALVIVVKNPGENARVLNREIEEPREFIQDFKSLWDELGEKVRAEIIRGLV